MRLLAMGLMLMMVPLMLAGNRVEVRIDSPVQISAAVEGDVAAEVAGELKAAAEELQRNLGGKIVSAPMPGEILPIPQDALVPDVYPSQRAAIRSLVEQWVRQLVLSLGKLPMRVDIVVSGRNAPSDVIQQLRSAVHNQLPGVPCSIQTGEVDLKPTPQVPAGAVWGELELKPGEGQGEGEVSLKSNVPALAAISVAFVSKPWVDSFAEFANRRPGVERWVVGQSQQSCTSPAEATEDAMRQAVENVSGLLRTRLAGMGRPTLGVDEGWLAARIQSELERGGLIRDRFVQRYERPYGSLWREAVLVDVSESRINHLAAGVLDALRVRHTTWLNTAVSVLGLLVVIYLLYLLVNAVTKGYFVWRLRTAAVVLAAVGAVIVMWFITTPTQQWDRRVEHNNSSAQPADHAVPGYRMEY
ncbi:MAG: hypothetical protein ACM359_09845 [Bacillota bacterium]